MPSSLPKTKVEFVHDGWYITEYEADTQHPYDAIGPFDTALQALDLVRDAILVLRDSNIAIKPGGTIEEG